MTSQQRIDLGYADWVRDHDAFGAAERRALLARVAALRRPPSIAVLLTPDFPGFGPLADTLASLREQLYPHWDILVAGPASAELLAWAKREPRMRLLGGGPYADPAVAANAALPEVNADFLVWLAPGDRLPAYALADVALELAEHPELHLLYTDEDCIDPQGRRFAPRFKTGWDPDLLLAHDYIGGLAVWRVACIVEAGGWRPGFAGATAYDLTLRATGRLGPDHVVHLPGVRLHRPASSARSLRDAMLSDAPFQGRRAVQDYLGSRFTLQPSPLLPSLNRIVWPLPEPAPKVSIIMPTRDRAELFVPAAWGVLLRTDYPDFELLIVDNDSVEPVTHTALSDLRADPRVRVLHHPGPFNYPAINNAAVRAAAGEVIVLLNNDVDVIGPGWLREMVSHAIRPEIGAVGARLLYADGSLQHGGIVFGPGLNATHILRQSDRGDPGYLGLLAATRSFLAVTAACLAMRRSVFEEVGGLDAEHLAVAFNDVDLCLRLGDYGYRVICTPFAELFHRESQSRGSVDTPDKRAREQREIHHLWRTWRPLFDSDPYHPPNLTCAWHTPLQLCPPRRPRPWQLRRPGAAAA